MSVHSAIYQRLLSLVHGDVIVALDQLNNPAYARLRGAACPGTAAWCSTSKPATASEQAAASTSARTRRRWLLQFRQWPHPRLLLRPRLSALNGTPRAVSAVVVHQPAGLGRCEQPPPYLVFVEKSGVAVDNLVNVIGALVELGVPIPGRRGCDRRAFGIECGFGPCPITFRILARGFTACGGLLFRRPCVVT